MVKSAYEMVEVKDDEALKACVKCLNEAFLTLVDPFKLTPENAPNNGAFLDFGKLKSQTCKGLNLYALLKGQDLVATVGVKHLGGHKYEVSRLAVLPNYRHKGLGKKLMYGVEAQLMKHAHETPEKGHYELHLGCIAEDIQVTGFYESLGYTKINTKSFKKLPHKVCFMKKRVKA